MGKARWWLGLVAVALAGCSAVTGDRLPSLRPVPGGVDVLVDGKVVAPLRLSSNGVLEEGKTSVTPREVRLGPIACRDEHAVSFGRDSFVSVTLRDGLPTLVRFRLQITAFDPERWALLFDQPAPFHFLTLAMPSAQVWHQRGWLNATPNADPFPLLGDTHVGEPEISCKWNRNWSYLCPMGGSPIPMLGLWDPSARLYLGYDFQCSRAGDQSERFVSGAYCWQQGADRSFVTLTYPYGGAKFGRLVYPKAGDVIESACELIIDPDLPAWEDPNERFQTRLFARWADHLPRVPETSDLGWVAGKAHLQDFVGGPNMAVWGNGGEGTFYPEGTELVHGWGGHRELPIESALNSGEPGAVEMVRRRVDDLVAKYAKRFVAGDDSCLYFEKPLSGAWRENWGGPGATTLHNTDAFYVGRLLLGLYRHRMSKPGDLDVIDGMMRWARQFVWSRNEFADVPSSPFAIGGTLSASFLLDYYHTFRDDAQRRKDAAAALTLADRLTWRYLVIWAMDSDRYDAALDGSFLAEPNSGRDWAALACANEVFWNLDTACQVYVHTGDARLRYYLRGIAERWPQLYRAVVTTGVADADQRAMTEGLGLFDGAGPGRGERYAYGWHDILAQMEPVGASKVRVVAGPAAVIEFGRDGCDIRAVDYRTDGRGQCSFRLAGTTRDAFDLSFSYPAVDVSAQTVRIARADKLADWREHTRRPKQAPSCLYLSGLRAGDWVHIGTVPPGGQSQTFTAPPALVAKGGALPSPTARYGDFVPTPSLGGTQLPRGWSDPRAFAGLEPGMKWSCGVPVNTGLLGATEAIATTMPRGARSVLVAYAPPLDRVREARPELVLAGGKQVPVAGRPVLLWRAWPPVFQPLVLLAYADIPLGARVTGIDNHATTLLGVTWCVGRGLFDDPRRKAAWDGGAAALDAELTARADMVRLRARFARLPAVPMAFVPPTEGSLGQSFLQAVGLAPKVADLSPQELVDPARFNGEKVKVAFYTAAETYWGTVKRPNDGEEAIARYLSGGGTLVCLGSQPLPFCYHMTLGQTGQKANALLPRLGFPVGNAWEEAPAGLTLTNANPTILTSVPATLPWPNGDQRLRSVEPGTVAKAHRYRPLISVKGADGRLIGDAACVIDLGEGPAKGGRIVYVWSTLGSAPAGQQIMGDVVAWAVEEAARR